jgi:hypothetical protein
MNHTAKQLLNEATEAELNATLEILHELRRAQLKYPAMAGPREGWETLNCEVWEMHREIYTERQNAAALRKETAQVGAMALRYLLDVCDRRE